MIQSDKSLVIFLCWQVKLQLLNIIKLCCFAQAIEKFFWRLFNLKKACFFSFAILRSCKSREKAFAQADRAINWYRCSQNFLKIKNKWDRLSAKNLKQPVSTQDLPVLRNKSVLRPAHFEHFWNLKLLFTNKFTHQQPQGRFTSFTKIAVWKKLFLFHIDPKIYLNSVWFLKASLEHQRNLRKNFYLNSFVH